MSNGDRRFYENAGTLDQAFLDNCHDNLECQLVIIVDIDSPTGTIRVSNRPQYVGTDYYDNRITIPIIKRTIGEWLSTSLAFSVFKIQINNADGNFNDILPGGANYDGFIGRSITVKAGLRDVSGTYFTVFKGEVSEVSGFQQTTHSFILSARDDYESLTVKFPTNTFDTTTYTFITDDIAGQTIPVIYGDWTVSGTRAQGNASVVGFVVNANDPDMNGVSANTEAVQVVVADNDLVQLLTSDVVLKRGDLIIPVNAGDITVGAGNKSFTMTQSGATTVDGNPYTYDNQDEFFVKCKGKDLGVYDDNLVSQARDILETYASVPPANFDTTWDTFRDKDTPLTPEDSVSLIASRVWIQKPQSTIEYVLSMLEQVRLEAFIDRNQKLKINSLHFSDLNASPTHKISNFDTAEGSLRPKLDNRNNFNRSKGLFNRLPDTGENENETDHYQNLAAVTQMGRAITNPVVFPNLYVSATVVAQLGEIIKLASSGYEHIFLETTWRSLLIDVGDFVFLDVQIGSSVYEDIPCSVREVGIDPRGFKIPMRLWSFELVPFPGNAGASGSVGGSTATITIDI